jgi:chorismate mutase
MKTISTLPNPSLEDYRASLDNLDNALIYLLTERFRITAKVGEYKRDHNLPPQDKKREAAQLEHIKIMAKHTGLDPEFAAKLLRLIVDEVVANHKKLRG